MIPLGIRLYGLGALATGLIGLIWDDFALQWQPVPPGFPGRDALAYVFAALLVLGGAAVNWSGFAVLGAVTLSVLYGVDVLVMHGADVLQHPASFGTWAGVAEQLSLLAAAVAAYAYLTRSEPRTILTADAAVAERLRRLAVTAMGICCVLFGLAHFFYLGFTAAMVPAWIPGGQTFWAILTGVAHIAAGVALLTGVQARLAAVLLTIMFASFGILVHLPLVIGNANHLNWVMNAVNLSLTGAAWTIAHAVAQPRSLSYAAAEAPDEARAPSGPQSTA